MKLRSCRRLAALLLLLGSTTAVNGQASLEFDREAGAVVAWQVAPADDAEIVVVRLDPARANHEIMRLLGVQETSPNGLLFRPRFGFRPGQSYYAELVAQGVRYAELEFTVEHGEDESAGPTVSSVFPNQAEVPSNLLRFYISFSHPMNRGNIRDAIFLEDDEGNRLTGSFLEIGREMWSSDMQVLTLILDPGRLKTGVEPNRQVGTPLEGGQNYTLVIDADMTDSDSRRMNAPVRISFSAHTPDIVPPSPTDWTLSSTGIGRCASLIINTNDASIDPYSVAAALIIFDSNGEPVPGDLIAGVQSEHFEFIPAEPWRGGSLTMRILPTLEDMSGNRVGLPFETQDLASLTRGLGQSADREIQLPRQINDASLDPSALSDCG